MLIKTKTKMENTYHSEFRICKGSTYCDHAINDIKRRMFVALVREIPIDKLEKLFNFNSEKEPEGTIKFTTKITI